MVFPSVFLLDERDLFSGPFPIGHLIGEDGKDENSVCCTVFNTGREKGYP